MAIDTSIPRPERFRWPKAVPPLSPEQRVIVDDFIKHWHEVLARYGIIERFNHSYALRSLPATGRSRTLEVGAGIGGHLAFEPLERQEYHCIDLRPAMAAEIDRRYPGVVTVIGDCQERIPYEDGFFDRVVVIHVLEHLPHLPRAVDEIARVLKRDGVLSVVLPCDPGLLYEFARKISAERIFRNRYRLPYRWYIRREHINSPAEIRSVLRQHFHLIEITYFPLRLPIMNLNLCIGLTARKIDGERGSTSSARTTPVRTKEAQSTEAATGVFNLRNVATEGGRLIRFGLTGILATAVYTVVSLLAIEALGFSPVAGSVLGYAASMGVSFYGHTLYSFKVDVDHGSSLRRFLIMAAASFILSTGLMWLLAEVLDVPPRIAIAAITIMIPINNYICSRFWVFRPGLAKSASGRDAMPRKWN